jgi:hypothetical protein
VTISPEDRELAFTTAELLLGAERVIEQGARWWGCAAALRSDEAFEAANAFAWGPCGAFEGCPPEQSAMYLLLVREAL